MAPASQRLRVPPEMKLLIFKLVASLAIDAIGASSFVLPVVGELFDLGWAPVSAALVWYLYGDRRFVALNFLEEVLPFTDWIPSATLAWLAELLRIVSDTRGNDATGTASGGNAAVGTKTALLSTGDPGSLNIMVFSVHWTWSLVALLLLVAIAYPYRA